MEKKKYMILSGAMAIFMLIVVVFVAIMLTRVRISELRENNYAHVDLSRVENGSYYGEESAGLIKVKLEVTIEDGKITEIDIISHRQGRGKAGEGIIEDIIRVNSINVDAVSGATNSGEVIKAAVYNALSE